MAPIPRRGAYTGPAILSYGFRPFFLFGAIYAALGIALWLPQYLGEISLPNVLPPPLWHAHEMLFGFAPAVITGFLLTAIPNWTGRLPLQGGPLLALVLAWLAGRIAIAASALIGWAPTMLIDCAYLLVLAAAIAREIIAGENWRNLKVLLIVAVLFAGNVAFHLEAHATGAAPWAERAAIATIVTLVTLVGGRITPSFTRNWLVRENPGRLPAPNDRLDAAFVAVSTLAAVSWVVFPASVVAAGLMLAAAVAQAIRLARWVGWRARSDALVLVLHVAYAFVPVGFVLNAGAALFPGVVSPTAGIHAWTVGAIGGMILAVMTRATLGHTGCALQASKGTIAIYLAVAVAALARVWAAFAPAWSAELLHVAAFAWIGAFAGFAASYGPLLVRKRRAARN